MLKMNSFQNFLFDLDGTLCDTEPDIVSTWRHALKNLGLACPRFQELYRTGPTLTDMAHLLFPEADAETVERIIGEYRSLYDESELPSTETYPWIPGWLEALRGMGKTLFVVTNKREKATKYLLKARNLDVFFQESVSSDSIPGARRKSDLIGYLLKKYGLDPVETVMIGDCASDVEAGKAAGVATAGVDWGYARSGELEASRPDLILSASAPELLRFAPTRGKKTLGRR